jgi:hypothetical protein
MTVQRNAGALCSPNRIGMLCGRCLPNFTQSLDGETCIENEICLQNRIWVWIVSIFGFTLYSLYIVLSCRAQVRENTLSCVVFFLQVSSFASSPGSSSGPSSVLAQISQVQSLVAFASNACYAPSMSAYDTAASKLLGPLFVSFLSLAWTWMLTALRARLSLHNIQINLTYSGTLAATISVVYSNVATVVIALVTCTTYDGLGVVFIDGSVPCFDSKWKGLVVVVVLLSLFPVAFFVALKFNKNARSVVCGCFTQSTYYWGALTLGFRFFISVLQFLQISYPIIAAFLRMISSLFMLVLLMNFRPHIFDRTFWVDVVCYACLIALFCLQVLFATIDNFAVTVAEEQRHVYDAVEALSSTCRYEKRLICTLRRNMRRTACDKKKSISRALTGLYPSAPCLLLG